MSNGRWLARQAGPILIACMLSACACKSKPCDNDVNKIFDPNQTSAELLMEYARIPLCGTEASAKPNDEARQRAVLAYDLYVKARSYSFLNKVFFWPSLAIAVVILLWPALGVIFKNRIGDREWHRSPIVQTTLTGLAALLFALYSQYKDKQTYTENLMRYAVFSGKPIAELAPKLIEELSRIDNGFSFTSIIGQGDDGEAIKNPSDPAKPQHPATQ